jgi:hypothetical protein
MSLIVVGMRWLRRRVQVGIRRTDPLIEPVLGKREGFLTNRWKRAEVLDGQRWH